MAAKANYEENERREAWKREKIQAYYDQQQPMRIYNSYADAVWIILFLGTAVVAVFFYIFAYQNPDPKDCFFYPGVEIPEKDPEVIKARALELNMAVV